MARQTRLVIFTAVFIAIPKFSPRCHDRASVELGVASAQLEAKDDRHADSEDAIDWHEWITDDEHRDSPGAEMLTWSAHEAWRVLSNGSTSTLSSPPPPPGKAPRPPVFLLAGIASTRLVNWREKACRGSNIKARDVVWVNIGKLVETNTIDPTCWVDCMKTGPGGTDLARGCVLRPDEGLDAVSAMAPGTWTSGISEVYAPLISLLVDELGYDAPGSLRALPYDWRLSPRRLEERDGFLTATKLSLEHAVLVNKRPAVVFAHSMGNLVFLYFLEWLKVVSFKGDRRKFQKWVDTHVWCYVGLSAPLLGAAGALRTSLDGETFGLPLSGDAAREMELTFDSTHWLNPRRVRGQGGVGGGGVGGALAEAGNWVVGRQHASRRGDWPRDLVRIRPDPNSNETVRFGVGEVAGEGALFSWLADREDAAAQLVTSRADKEAKDARRRAREKQNRKRKKKKGKVDDGTEDSGGEIDGGGGSSGEGGVAGSAPVMAANARAEGMRRKQAALVREYWKDPLGNPLRGSPLRPPVRHVVMAYGVDVPTDVGYRYVAAEHLHVDPNNAATTAAASAAVDARLLLEEVVVEEAGGSLSCVRVRDASIVVGKQQRSSKEERVKLKKGERSVLRSKAQGPRTGGHSGDGTVPYVSLSWAHTWLEDGMVPTVKLSTHGPNPKGALKGAAERSGNGRRANATGLEEATSSPPSSGGEGGGWTIFGFKGGGSNGNKAAATAPLLLSQGFAPVSAAASGGRTLWQRTSSSKGSDRGRVTGGGGGGGGKGIVGEKLEGLGDEEEDVSGGRPNSSGGAKRRRAGSGVLGAVLGSGGAVVGTCGAAAQRAGRALAKIGSGGGGGGSGGGGSGARGTAGWRDGGATTTAVLEIEGAIHTSLTTDPGALAVVLSHVLRHMDDDLCLEPPSRPSGKENKPKEDRQANIKEQEQERSRKVVAAAPTDSSPRGGRLLGAVFGQVGAFFADLFRGLAPLALAPLAWPFRVVWRLLGRVTAGFNDLVRHRSARRVCSCFDT